MTLKAINQMPVSPNGVTHDQMLDLLTMDEYSGFIRWYEAKPYAYSYFNHRPIYPQHLVDYWRAHYQIGYQSPDGAT